MGGKRVVASFVVLGGALVVFLLIFQNPRQEETILATGEGRNELGNPLRGRALPLPYIKGVVRQGRNKMPAFPHIQGEALENVAKYVNELR